MVMRRSLSKAWTELQQIGKRRPPPHWTGAFVLREGPRDANAPGLAVGVSTDRSFGPVIWIQRGSESHSLVRRRVVMLPPLNARLASDAIASALADVDAEPPDAAIVDALVELMTKLSALVCALPWVTHVVLDSVLVDSGRAFVVGARMIILVRYGAAGLAHGRCALPSLEGRAVSTQWGRREKPQIIA